MPLEERHTIDQRPYLGTPDGSEKVLAKRGGTTGYFLLSELQAQSEAYANDVLAQLQNDLSGGIVTAGSSDDFTVLSARAAVALPDGFSIAFTADRANTGAATLDVFAPNSLGQKALKKAGGAALIADDIVAGAIYQATYDTTTGYFYLRQGNAIAGLAPLASPALSGNPTAPTQPPGNSSTRLATTAFVADALGASWSLIETKTASSSSSIDFTGLSSAYQRYAFIITDLVPGTDNVDLYMRITEDGSAFKSGASDYAWTRTAQYDANTTYTSAGSTGDSKMLLSAGLSNAPGKSYSSAGWMSSPSNSSFSKRAASQASYGSYGNTVVIDNCSGVYKATNNPIVGIRFILSSGNIASGKISLFGIK